MTIPLVALPIACATIPPLTLQIEAESTRLSAPDPTQVGTHGTVVHARVAGGTPEYAYFWTVKDPMGQTHNELLDNTNGSDPTFHPGQLIGPYLLTCTVKDSGVGLVSDSIIIYASQDLGLSLSVNRKEVPSGGGVNGQVDVKGEVWGGSPPYTYNWSAVGPNGEPADDHLSGSGNTSRLFTSGAELGTYRISCTVTDVTGAIFLQTTEVVVSHLLSINVSSNRPIVTPGGGLTGLSTLTAEVSGGKPPYTYTWSVVGPDGLEGQWLDGSATEKTLFTSPMQTGTYRVVCTAKDATGGQVVGSMLILVSQQLSVSVTTNRQRISSDAGPSGQAVLKAFVIGGTSGYTYRWTVIDPDEQDATDQLNDRASASPVFTGGSAAGTYQILCEVTDAMGQVSADSLEVVVGQPLSLAVTVNSSRATSEGGFVDSKSEWVSSGGGADGQATVTAEAVGGSEPYVYTWNIVGPDGQPAPDRLSGSLPNVRFFHSAAAIGTYTVFCTVVDATGMTLNDSVKILVYDHLTLELLIDHMQMPANGGPSGTAHMQAVVVGGTPPYTYAWTITGPDGMEDNARLDDPAAATPVFTSGALSGIYRADCIVEDSVGQTQQNMLLLMVGQPVTLDVILDRTDVLAAGGQAHLYADARGGIPPYQYSWVVTNPAGLIENQRLDDTQIATPTFTSDLTTGTFSFTCTVTDASGFISTLSTSLVVGGGLDQGLSVSVTANHEALPAPGGQSSLFAAALGGVWPLTYEWVVLNPDGSTNNTALNDTAVPNPTFTAPGTIGTYRISCSVTDVVLKRFTDSIQVYVGMPLTLTASTDKVGIPASGGQAALLAVPNGGVSPYTYAWAALNPTGGNAAATLSSTVGAAPAFTAPATAGTYRFTCTVTDAAGTTAAHSLQIYVGMGLSLDVTAVKQSLPSGQTTAIAASAQGGIAPYSYAWSVLDPSGADASASLSATDVADPTFTAPATAGTYRATCTVTDAAGETFTQSLHLEVGMPLSLDVIAVKASIPVSGGTTLITASAGGGVVPYTYAWTATDPSGASASAALSSTTAAAPTFTAPATAGTYRFGCTVTDAAGTTFHDSTSIWVGMNLSLDVTAVKQSLPSGQTTALAASAQGGVAPYTYAWTVLDPSGADASASLSATDVTDPTFTAPAGAGTYRLTCTVTDSTSGTLNRSVLINVGTPVSIDVTAQYASIPAASGQTLLYAGVIGGVPGYTYAWGAVDQTGAAANGAISNLTIAAPTFTAPAAGTYRVFCTATDAAGATSSDSCIIQVGVPLSAYLLTTRNSLVSTHTATLSATASGGTAPYTYAWTVLNPSGADVTGAVLSGAAVASPTFTAPAASGVYRVTCAVSDARDATVTSSVHLSVGMPLAVDVTTTKMTLGSAGTAVLAANASGGAAPYTYAWTVTDSTGASVPTSLSSATAASPTFTAPANSGTYRATCLVTDNDGQTFSDSVHILVGMSLSLAVTTDKSTLATTGTANLGAVPIGGVPNYTYSWIVINPSGTDVTATALNNASLQTPIFTAPVFGGTYRVSCTVMDSASVTFASTVNIYVTTRVLTLTNPVAADASNAPTSVMASTPLTNQYMVLAVGVNLPYARNLQVRFNDPNGGIWASFYIAVDGVDANGDFQTEMFQFTNPSSGVPAGGTTVTGTKTFTRVDYVRWVRNVTSVTPSGDERVMIGVGDVFGLPRDLSFAASVRQVTLLPATNLATPADYTVVTTPGSQGVSFTNAATMPNGARSYEIYYDDD